MINQDMLIKELEDLSNYFQGRGYAALQQNIIMRCLIDANNVESCKRYEE